MKILAFMAHPDDIELLCAGTLVRLRKAGHDIAMATMTAGSCGSATLGPKEISDIRRVEAANSAAIIDADYHCAEIPDLEIVFDNPNRRKASDILRLTQPDIVITHYPQDYMYDHDMTSMLVRDATFGGTLRNYPTDVDAPPVGQIPYLYYASPVDGVNAFGELIEYQFVVDVTSTIETKVEMLACHASQREWLRAQHGLDEYIEYMRRETGRMGATDGHDYGEGYCQHLGHPYRQDNIILQLIGDV